MRERNIIALMRSSSGTAAAEMALVTPLLVGLMFGAFELGNYFYSEHVVAKAVRDGARFAGRQGFSSFSACTGEPTGTVPVTLPSASNVATATAIRNIVRTGQIASGGSARLAGWTNNNSIAIAITCNTTSTGAGKGIYLGQTTGIPVVTVTATVGYTSLFSTLGLSNGSSLNLVARSQAPVMGT